MAYCYGMRSVVLPRVLVLLTLPVVSCFVDTQGTAVPGPERCTEPEGVAICNDAGTHLLTCSGGEVISEICPLGCTPEANACRICVPGFQRCMGDLVMICNSDGSAEVMLAMCAAGTCNDDGSGVAECGACIPGTSRCDGAVNAVVRCGSAGREEPPVACEADERCEVGDSGTIASCVRGCVEGCDGDDRVVCTPTEVRETCSLGCNSVTTECNVMLPSNVGTAIDMTLGTAGLTVGTTEEEYLIFDTDDSGLIERYDPETGTREVVRAAVSGAVEAGIYHEQLSAVDVEIPEGAGPPDLAVWVMDSLTVGERGVLRFVGTRAAVLLVEGDVEVAGRIYVRGDWLLDAEGSEEFASAAAGGRAYIGATGEGFGGGGEGADDGNRRSGGGGGSFGSLGGVGGGAGAAAVPTDPGPTYGGDELVPLYGGSGGGAGADEVAAGGDGGGALQLSAGQTIIVGASGVIDASGEGGYGASADRGGGGGGGSGGGILLEAPQIVIEGLVGAPGGGGAGGTDDRDRDGASGTRWSPPEQLRGIAGDGSGRHGGTGGHGSSVAGGSGENGETKDDRNGGGGGGGGGAGRIRLNVRSGGEPMVSGRLVPDGSLSSTGALNLR